MSKTPGQPTKAEMARMLAAAQQPQPVQVFPIVIDLVGCNIKVDDAEVNGRPGKTITFIHMTGAIAAKASLITANAHDLATRLTAPPGVEIPTNGSAEA